MADEVMTGAAPAVTAGGKTGTLVLVGGTLTTALALVVIYLLSGTDWNVMGWYADYVLPIGALLMGLLASSGFGIASWTTGTKIGGRLLVLVLLILIGGYFLAEYLEFRLRFPGGAVGPDGNAIGFWGYFDFTSRAFAFEDKTTHAPGSPMGVWGYAFRALEIAGFALGGAAIPLILRSKPYCEPCQSYKRTRALAYIPASIPTRRVSKKEPQALAAYQAEQQAAVTSGQAALAAIVEAGLKEDGEGLRVKLDGLKEGRRAIMRLPHRIELQLVHCRRCLDGELKAAMLSGQGRAVRRQPLIGGPIAKTVVSQLAPRS